MKKECDNKLKHGVTMSVLIITIIVIMIISGTVIVTTTNTNHIKKANLSKYSNDVDNIQALLTSKILDISIQRQGAVDITPGVINKITSGKNESDGELTFKISGEIDPSLSTGKIVFDESKKGFVGNVYYISQNLPIYSTGITKWEVDIDGNLTLKIGEKSFTSNKK